MERDRGDIKLTLECMMELEGRFWRQFSPMTLLAGVKRRIDISTNLLRPRTPVGPHHLGIELRI